MQSVAAVSELRRALSTTSDSQRSIAAARALGWGLGRSGIEMPISSPTLGRLDLDSVSTLAALCIGDATSVALPKRAYLSGYRWLIATPLGRLSWYDLPRARQWTVSASDLTPRQVGGLTPDAFTRSGRLEPIGLVESALVDVTQLPGTSAAEYLLRCVEDWWSSFLAGEVEPGRETRAQQDFVSVLSALLFLSTVDALRPDWVTPRALDRATASQPNRSRVRARLQLAAEKFNSRVLRGVAEIAVSDRRLDALAKAIDDSDLDLGALDVDPVGSFYQKFLGQTEQVEPLPQGDLFQRNQSVKVDVTIRRQQGTYYTPRQYADLLARRLVRPMARTARDVSALPRILDPAVGSGELLCAAMREIFQVKEWRTAEAARRLLSTHLLACDSNPRAVQLAAVNVLRTAIRLVPSLLDGRLPSLDDNFRHVPDSLASGALDWVGSVDVALLNPPFLSRRVWRPQPDHDPVVRNLGPGANAAFAFLAVAIKRTRDGGAVGAVMPSQPLGDLLNRKARSAIAQQLALDTVVENFGSPFPGALSYAGLVLGHRMTEQYSMMEALRVPGGVRSADVDVAAALASASELERGASEVTRKCRRITSDAAWDWTGTREAAVAGRGPAGGPRKIPRRPLRELLATGAHDAISPAPGPWGRNLFLFEETRGGESVRHLASKKELRAQSHWLRPVALPRRLTYSVPIYGEPVVSGLWTWLPGSTARGLDSETVAQEFPSDLPFHEAIRAAVSSSGVRPSALNAGRWFESLEAGRVRYLWPRGYVDSSLPQIIASRGTLSVSGRSERVLWNVWISLDGTAVPFGGTHMRAKTVESAIAIACLFNIEEAVAGAIQSAPRRNLDSSQPRIGDMLDRIRLPDIEDDRAAEPLSQLMAAFEAYRSVVGQVTPEAALRTREYRVMMDCARGLWRA